MPVRTLREFSASGAHKHILGMSLVLGKEIAWKQINVLTTFGAGLDFDPEKVFHRGGRGPTKKASRSI
jgi:hypothetical protein